jgi:hypothetical protein
MDYYNILRDISYKKEIFKLHLLHFMKRMYARSDCVSLLPCILIPLKKLNWSDKVSKWIYDSYYFQSMFCVLNGQLNISYIKFMFSNFVKHVHICNCENCNYFNSMMQGSWKAYSQLAVQEFFCLLKNPKVHHRTTSSASSIQSTITAYSIPFFFFLLPNHCKVSERLKQVGLSTTLH